MKDYNPKLDMAGLLYGGTTAAAQSHWLRLNGDSFKNVGRDFPHDRPKKVAEREAANLKRGYNVDLKREAFRTLQELVKVGQGLEKERVAKLAFRASGRKAATNKPDPAASTFSTAVAMDDPQPIPASASSIEQRPAAQPTPIDAPVIDVKPRIFTMVKDQVSGDNPLKPVLMSYVKGLDVAELKRALGQVVGDWRVVQVPADCRAALEWVDAQ